MPPKSAPAGNATSRSRAKRAPSPLNTGYLIAYNFASAISWGFVLWTVLSIGTKKGWESGDVFEGTDRLVRLTQTAAGLEVLHSLLGVVRAPLFTTLMQVASRFLLVWGIAYHFPAAARHSPMYSSMLLAWSVTEVVRYGFFVFSLSGMGVPGLVTWLRYNTFIILYPLGISSECWLIYKSIAPSAQVSPLLPYGLYAILAIYVPGAYILLTHMWKQRSKIMSKKVV
ncbi:protein tyrosine phosphatase [Amniculicola lignicola CBS 123094]|uniref:Very-long-chain (3R)-3-hydroxyacyl-CoA dehydratase n=1 Tax=Amniculicola lignicola CBS 123094 TaxID=1392246 RepID=A0A6A5WVP7_9PLEO|nr:protein tyrosine phosphatase [Amniculicola lignicola CBS 123094]